MVNPVCSVDGQRVPCDGRSLADLDVMYLAAVAEWWLPLAVGVLALLLFTGSVAFAYMLVGGRG